MPARFTYNDVVVVSESAPREFRPGSKAWIIAVFEDATLLRYREFLPGAVYGIEFEDGAAVDLEEKFLELFPG